MKNEKGMTLIELLAVIVIIAIIALIAIPAIGNIINNSKDKAILSDTSQIIAGAKIAIADGACGGDSAINCDEKVLADYIEKADLETGATYLVTKSNSEYTVKYSGLTKLTAKGKYSGLAGNTGITSKDLADYMKNGKTSK
ncbi:prepilin-type N-terminal cleavage/methylation domain-containing protein [Viridibacillus sp. YIM B01967]|uniref:Prepilin-type N-terminal cleavage/methylation domain-containing protein n=2 Tax=Viridibacillus soli TaxID=2798301 RepID=A0ABS1H313_9BACL|nr:prepilin-type N-terminal cleavage/methylation domain-containing protein [Viridibacillus soli]